MIRLSRFHLVVVLAACCLVSGTPSLVRGQGSEVVIVSTRTAYRKTDILLNEFDVLSGGENAVAGSDLVATVLRNDLQLSGLCRIGTAGADPDSFNFEFTIEGRIEGALMDAEVSGEETPLTVSLDLLTYPGRQLLLGKRYRPLGNQLRLATHHFANEVLAMVTGQEGICLTRIAFSRGSGDRRDLFVVDYDGQGLMRVTANRTLNLCPDWSPDNGQIAFTSYQRGQQGLYSLDTSSGKVRLIIAQKGLNLGADWSPDGKELLASLSRTGNPEIYRLDPAGRVVKRLTVSPAIEVSPSWSPGGQEVVFTSDRTGTPQLYIMDKDGSGRRRLTFEGQYNDSGAWSPRGDRLVYATRIGNLIHLVLIKPTGEDRRVITDDGWGNCEDPSWAPDARHLVFASDRSGVFKLYVYDVVEESFRQLTYGDDPDITPAWSY